MLLPLFTLASATLCIVGYMMLAADEQRQEFGTLRAVGARPNIIVSTLAIQSGALLVSSFAVGLSVGTVVLLIILMAHPIVTAMTFVEIGAWLAGAIVVMFILSIIPALRLKKTSILKSLG